MAKVGFPLKQALETKAARTAFMLSYRGSTFGLRLQRGLAQILKDEPDLLTFFDDIFVT